VTKMIDDSKLARLRERALEVLGNVSDLVTRHNVRSYITELEHELARTEEQRAHWNRAATELVAKDAAGLQRLEWAVAKLERQMDKIVKVFPDPGTTVNVCVDGQPLNLVVDGPVLVRLKETT
jgi:hypothetical protein